MTQLRVVFLHALPLNGNQWRGQVKALGKSALAPTLYSFGETLGDWATEVLRAAGDDRLIVVGNSVGGSCALEMARQAPHRIVGLLLIGTKASHRPEPDFACVRVFHTRPDAAEILSHWRKPLLLVHGEQDGVSASRPYPSGPHVRMIPNCGHYVNLEQPRVFNSLLRAFVKSCAAPS